MKKEILLTLLVAIPLLLLSGCKNSKPAAAERVTPAFHNWAPTPPMGFFLDGWQPRTYFAPQFTGGTIASSSGTIVTVDAANVITKIPLTVFGHNANTIVLVNEKKGIDIAPSGDAKTIRYTGKEIMNKL